MRTIESRTDSKVTQHFKERIQLPTLPSYSSITKATAFRLTWAMVLARYCDSDDITFGTTVSGRQAPVRGLETMAGPMVATVPVRVQLVKAKLVSGYLADVQDQAIDMVPYEQFGLQNISKISPDMKEAVDFSSLLVVQPAPLLLGKDGEESDAVLSSDDRVREVSDKSVEGYFSYPLVVQCIVFNDCFDLLIVYDTTMLDRELLKGLARQFNHVTQQLMAHSDNLLLGDIEMAGD